MFSQWISRLSESADKETDAPTLDVERVSAALLVEIARADHVLDDEEIESITQALQVSSALPEEELREIVSAAVKDADAAISLHEHIRLINENFDQPQKGVLLEQMWRVAVADGNIDKYEAYTIKKLGDLLHVRHSVFIQAKLRVIPA